MEREKNTSFFSESSGNVRSDNIGFQNLFGLYELLLEELEGEQY